MGPQLPCPVKLCLKSSDGGRIVPVGNAQVSAKRYDQLGLVSQK
jgi:hypothetical protein